MGRVVFPMEQKAVFKRRRVVVTGLGLVTPLGTGVEKSWGALCRGESGIDKITTFDASSYPVRIAGEVKDFDPANYIEKKEIKKMDRFIHFALACGDMVMADSALKITKENELRAGVIVGAGFGGLPAIEKYHTIILEQGPRKISPFFIPMLVGNMAAGQISMRYGMKGKNLCIVTACTSGTHAVGDSFRLIENGEADIMVAGGAESVICPLTFGGFAAMKALSERNDEPKRASRPFDLNRDGFVVGEGAGLMVLEEHDYAAARGAKIYAEIVGYGVSADAYHITQPDPKAEGAINCMQHALNDAGMGPNAIDYINAHGTSTAYNDLIETMAIKKVFGDHAKKIAVSSNKSMIGHLLGAAGGAEAVFTVLSIAKGIIPPTINYETPDPECDLDYVPNHARQGNLRAAISNSFGFGGTNAAIVFKAYHGKE